MCLHCLNKTGVHKYWATKLCMVVSNICGYSLWCLLRVTHLVLKSFEVTPRFLGKPCTPELAVSSTQNTITVDIHRAVHHNIRSIVKLTRCTNVSNLFYFGMTLYMFRMVFPSIIRSSRLYIQLYLFDKCLLPCVLP